VIDVSWRIEDEDRDYELTGSPPPLLGTWHYLMGSLRRGWRTWAVMAFLGADLGLVAFALLPPTSRATSLVLMAHPTNVDAQSAMSTDVSLLTTREVAARTTQSLGLGMSPTDFQSTVSANPVTSEVLAISVSAPDDSSAVTRTDALTEQYLTFRAEQLRSLSKGVVDGYRARIRALQSQVAELTTAYAKESGQGTAGQDRASDLLTRRSQLNAQIVEMQATVEDAALAADAAVDSTHVLDRATVERQSVKRRVVLTEASGVIVGTALGIGIVLFRALTSDKVLRRQDVAAALGAPVRFSVVSTGRPRGRGALVWGGRRGWRGDDLPTLVQGLSSSLSTGVAQGADRGKGGRRQSAAGSTGAPARQQGVALLAIDNASVGADVVAGAAKVLGGSGRAVLLVDLSPWGALVDRLAREGVGRHPDPPADSSAGVVATTGLTVYRPAGSVSLARGPRGAARPDGHDVAADAALQELWAAADVVLVLADVDPGIDAENLASWAGQAVPLVTAGQSSAELLRTTAELARTAGLALPFAMMVGADRADESLGLRHPDAVEAAPTGIQG
jgi:capsular polysaccharide biosynthesis protein